MASLPAVFGVAVDAVGAVGAVVAEIVSHRAMVTGDFTPLFLTALSGQVIWQPDDDVGVPAASNQWVPNQWVPLPNDVSYRAVQENGGPD